MKSFILTPQQLGIDPTTFAACQGAYDTCIVLLAATGSCPPRPQKHAAMWNSIRTFPKLAKSHFEATINTNMDKYLQQGENPPPPPSSFNFSRVQQVGGGMFHTGAYATVPIPIWQIPDYLLHDAYDIVEDASLKQAMVLLFNRPSKNASYSELSTNYNSYCRLSTPVLKWERFRNPMT